MNKKQRTVLILVLLLVVSVSAVVLAAGEMLPRSLVSGGGGLVLHNAVGQPVTGPVSNGVINMCSGFWCGATALGNPGLSVTYLPVVVKD